MVGYDTEDKCYCMELTYNYGLSSYTPGTGLTEFGIYVPDVNAALGAAKQLNYEAKDGVVVGPDQYRFRLLPTPANRSERFLYVLCRVSSLERSVAFYKDFLGMSDAALPDTPGLPAKAAAVSYSSNAHPHKLEPVLLVLYEDGVAPAVKPWEGRQAFCMDEQEVKQAYKKFKAEKPELIMHDGGDGPLALKEKLGMLFIFIVKDPDGYEQCLVSRETMLPAAIEAVTNYDPQLLNWPTRDDRIAAIEEAGKQAQALIKEHPVVVFSKEWCGASRRAKEALTDAQAAFFAKELETADRAPLVKNVDAFQDYLAASTNLGRTVPKVFIKGECIGGGDDTVALHRSGQLGAKCLAAGAKKAEQPAVSRAETNMHYFVNGRTVSLKEFEETPL